MRSRRDPYVFAVRHEQAEPDREPLYRLAWRYRAQLAPAYAAAAVWTAGAASHTLAGPAATVLLVAPILAAAVARARSQLDRRLERAYAYTLLVGAAGWTVAAAQLGPAHPVLGRVLLLGALLAAVPWWTHRRVRARIRVERVIDAWPRMAQHVGLAGSRLSSAVVTTWGWSGRVVLSAGQTARDLAGRLRQVESALKLPVGAARAEPWLDRADVALLRVVEHDPHAAVIEWPGTPAESIAVPLDVGPYEDGEGCRVPLYDKTTGTHHALIAGTNGSGKSGLLNLIACHAATAPDAVLWGIDLKGGTELRPWWPVVDWLATTQGQAADLLAAARNVIDERGQALTGRVWKASPKRPVLVILIDEAAELPADTVPDLESIARRGRALGVLLVLATQYPTVSAVGSGQVRGQLRTRAAFRFARTAEAATVLNDTTHTDPSVIRRDRPGCCYLEAAGAERAALVRAFWLPDDTITAVVDTWRDRQSALDTISARAAGPAYQSRPRPDRPAEPACAEPGSGTAGPAVPLTALADTGTPPAPRLTADQARTALRNALIDAGPAGTTVEALAAACDRRKSWIYRELTGLEAAGYAARTDQRGHFHATPRLTSTTEP